LPVIIVSGVCAINAIVRQGGLWPCGTSNRFTICPRPFSYFLSFLKKKGEKKKEAGWLVAGPKKDVRDVVNDAVARAPKQQHSN
jgi:hypothetical protein